MKRYLFDSHAHLDDARFDDDRNEIIASLQNAGVERVINVGSSVQHSIGSVALADRYEFIYAAVGIHPHYANEIKQSDIQKIRELSANEKVIAIGEIGLDYHYDNTIRENQQRWFKSQLALAEELNFPVIIHCRDANGDLMQILREQKRYREEKGVLHCFSGSVQMAKEAVNLGYLISFSGTLTYKNARMAVETAEQIPLEKILIETDCPYLAPQGHRGERNNPAYVDLVCTRLAEIKNIDFDTVAKTTNANTRRLFCIKE